ncbi:TetR/AcrR family transcriptional regulator [Chitinivorax sp. PXF-14]|uniref:TetR/AcrR family transcriptional regulator n=1 Tax=Chitinivorax sp. PXF-14 TaxID=3230488 RepID=UPI003467763E
MNDTPTPRRRGRPPKGDNNSLRKELIAKSAALFRSKGYERTTVRDIAAASGVQAGSWFYYFKTKQDILAAVMEEGMANSLERIETLKVEALPAPQAFRALIHAHLDTILSPNHDFIPVLLYEWNSLEAPAQARIIALQHRYEALWDAVIARLQAAGDWAMPTRIDRLMVFGALNWMAQWYKQDGRMSLDELVDQALVFFMRSEAAVSHTRP